MHIAVQQYIQYTMVCSHVGSNSVLLAESGDTTSLFANKEGSSSERRMEGGIADKTSMPPLKCECFGSAAQGQPPSWVHTGLTASSMNVKCHRRNTKIGQVSTARSPVTKSPFLLMTNQNTTSPALHRQNQPPDSGSVHESQRRQLRLSLHRSHRNTCCVCFCVKSVLQFPRREEAKSLLLVLQPPKVRFF